MNFPSLASKMFMRMSASSPILQTKLRSITNRLKLDGHAGLVSFSDSWRLCADNTTILNAENTILNAKNTKLNAENTILNTENTTSMQ